MRISDWSSDVCSSDLERRSALLHRFPGRLRWHAASYRDIENLAASPHEGAPGRLPLSKRHIPVQARDREARIGFRRASGRSEEHTSELQSIMRIPYAVFCLKTQTTHR